MAHPPSTCTIEVDLTNVLWFTRGKRWDHVALLRPLLAIDHDWASVQWRIFMGLVPEMQPQHVSGAIRRGDITQAYLATIFLDPLRRDAEGLPVAHRVVWFPPNEETARIVAPADWGQQLLAALWPAFDTVFNVVAHRVLPHEGVENVRDLFAREAAELAQPLRLEGPAVMVYAQRPFDSWRAELPYASPGDSYLFVRALLAWAAIFALLGLLAFVLRRGS